MVNLTARARGVSVPTFESGSQVKKTYQQRYDIRGFTERDLESEPIAPGEIRNLYPRDGFQALAQLERDVSALVGVPPENLLAFHSGMSAVVTAIELKHPTAGTTVLVGMDHYTENFRYITDELRPRGVKVITVDSGDAGAVRRAIERNAPDVIFFETIANGTSMATVDLGALFKSLSLIREKDPLLILDNTLTTPTTAPPSITFGDGSVMVVVVESGMKSYSMNEEMFGIAYTNDRKLWTKLFSSRITRGYTPSPSAVETIRPELPATKDDFDVRNQLIFGNTLVLAEACLLSANTNQGLAVIHPNLPNHDNHLLAQAINPNGTVPVFYISKGSDPFKLTDQLLEDPVVRQYCEISQSFGFDTTRLYPYYGNPYVRISGGTETAAEVRELADALTAALKRV